MLHWSTSGAPWNCFSFPIWTTHLYACVVHLLILMMMNFQLHRIIGMMQEGSRIWCRKQSQHYEIKCIYWNSPIFGLYKYPNVEPCINHRERDGGVWYWQELVHDCGHEHWCLERGRVGAIFTGGSMLSGADISRPVWCVFQVLLQASRGWISLNM